MQGPGAESSDFGTLPKFGTGEARQFKFDTQIDHSKSMDDKFSKRGRGQVFVTLFHILGPLYIFGTGKADTSNVTNQCNMAKTS